MTPSIETQARDLTLNLNDSCNCCCWGGKRQLPPTTQVYVHHTGEVVIFNPSRTSDRIAAMARCMSNLKTILDNMEAKTEDQKEAVNQLKKRVISIDNSPPSPITLDLIEDVIRLQNNEKDD